MYAAQLLNPLLPECGVATAGDVVNVVKYAGVNLGDLLLVFRTH